MSEEPISENIVLTMYANKRTLCLISDKFIASQYCMKEFDIDNP